MRVWQRSGAAICLLSLAMLGRPTTADEPAPTPAPSPPASASEAAAPAESQPAAADPEAAGPEAADPAAAPSEPPKAEPAGTESAPPPEAPAAEKPTDEPAVSFREHIAPILVQQCLGCHGDREAQSDFQLNSFAALGRPGASGEASLTPGQPEASLLYTLVASTDADRRMPLEGDPLAAEQVDLIRRWIAAGAPFDGPDPAAPLASYAARPPHPSAPESYRAAMPVMALAFRPDGSELAVGGYREVLIYDPASGDLRRRLGNVAERVYGLAWSPDGSVLAIAGGVPGEAGEVRLVNGDSGAVVRELGTTSDVALCVSFNAEGSRVASGAADRSIRVWQVADGTQQVLIEDHADWVLGLGWSADGARLASASRDKTSKVFDAATGDAQTTYSAHGQAVMGVAFGPDGAQVFSGGGDRKVHVWNPADGAKIAEIGGFGHEISRLLVRETFLFTASADKLVRQHRLDNRELVRDYKGLTDWAYALDVHAPSQRVAAASFAGEVLVWNLADGATIAQWIAAPGLAPASEGAAAAASD